METPKQVVARVGAVAAYKRKETVCGFIGSIARAGRSRRSGPSGYTATKDRSDALRKIDLPYFPPVRLCCPMNEKVAISDRRESELSRLGLAPLVHWKNTDYGAFISAPSLHRPVVYDDPNATAAASLSSRLPFLMVACRFMPCVMCMVRDEIGTFMEKSDLERRLNDWLVQYVTNDPSASDMAKAKYPLAAGRLEIHEVPGVPGYWEAILYVRPHFQLEGLPVSFRLVGRLRAERW